MDLDAIADKIIELEARKLEELRIIDEAKASDPFWWYEPNDGIIEGARKEFLEKWLKPEDVPGVVDSQADAHRSVADIIAVGGGNQSSKSVFGAIESFIYLTGELPESMESWYPREKIPERSPVYGRVVGVDYKTMLNTLIPTYQEWVPRNYLKNGLWRDSWSAEQNKLFLYKGKKVIGTLEFMTNQMNVESFQGPPLDFIVYDEEPRRDIYKENLLRFTTADRLRVIFAMTPTKGLTWVKDSIFDKVDVDGNSVDTFKLASVCNKKANLKVLNEVLKGLDGYDERLMRLLGEFVSLSGLVYSRIFNKSTHVIDPFPITQDFIVYRGIDPHLVKPTVCVEIAVDRENIEYVVGTYSKDATTEVIKEDLSERAKGYRLGWTMCDKSADSTIRVLGDRNIFRELKTGKNAIPALFTSEKYAGSIHAGVDVIKRKLKLQEGTGAPALYIFNKPENRLLIKALETLERETYDNEDKKGMKDRIAEGKHDAHAALRYAHQRIMRWIPAVQEVPEYEPTDEAVNY